MYNVVYDNSREYRPTEDQDKVVDPEDKSNYKLCLTSDVKDLETYYGKDRITIWTDKEKDVNVAQVNVTDMSRIRTSPEVLSGRTWRWITRERFIQLCNDGAFWAIDNHDWFYRVAEDTLYFDPTYGTTRYGDTVTRGKVATESRYRRF